jgi:carboxyl-terminal processing protease
MDELLAGALDGTTDALDPMATFVPAPQVDPYREVRKIGPRHSGLTVAKERGITFVVAVDRNSPGEAAGLEQGDIIAKFNDRSTRRLPLWQLQTILAQEPGTELQLEVIRRGQTRDMTLVLGSYATAPPELGERSGLSVLRIPRFDRDDLDEVRASLAQLVEEGRDRLLIDVRGVAGGAAEAAFAMAGLFVDGSLGELSSRDDATLHFQSQEKPVWRGETVVLIDNGTQGAAEIFATVLRQGVDSQLVGRRSFGHAGRQRLLSLSDGSQLLLTDAFYSGPDGKPIDRSLDPDVVVSEFNRRLVEEEITLEELTLERGLELLLELPAEAVEDVA